MVSKKIDVGLVGYAGAGKDTAAFGLMREGWHRKGFADLLKMRALDIGWDGSKDAKGRKLLQVIGCAVREYDPEFWVREAFARIDPRRPYVWTDVRFQNEVDFLINERKAVIIRIVRPGLKAGKHESESGQAELVGVTHEVVNDGTIEDLHRKVVNILNA